MSAALPPDEAERARARGELATSFLVEAGAGTGKTRLLVERLANLVAATDDLSGVVATTFTEKAAAELKSRLRAELGARRRVAVDAREQARFAAALEHFERIQVSTIHGFCARLLRERPVEAGLDPGFSIAQGEALAAIEDDAQAAVLRTFAAQGDRALRDAFASDLTVGNLRELLRRAVAERDVFAEVEPEDLGEAPDLARARAEFSAAAARLLALAQCCRDPEDGAATAVREIARTADRLRGASEEEGERLLLREPVPVKFGRLGNKRNWAPAAALAELRTLAGETFEALERYRARVRVRRSAALREAVRTVLPAYAAECAARSAVDFTELLLRVRDLLRDDAATRRWFQRRFRQILVDEFQDTDPLQAEIVFFLAEDPAAAPAARWDQVAVGPGRLFLVGDPKQSIYRFRRADVEVYERARERIVASGGEVLGITASFRSDPGILEWVNRRFAELIRKPADGRALQPDYRPLLPAPGSVPRGPGVAVLAGPANLAQKGELRQAESAAIAGLVRALVERNGLDVSVRDPDGALRPARYRDVALLFRTTSALPVYEAALRAAAVPFRVVGGKHLYSRAEVKAAVVLFRAVDDPTDAVAVAALLRSPLFGLADRALARHVALGGTFDYRAPPPSRSPRALGRAFALLRELHESRNRRGVARTVEEVLARTRAVELFLVKPGGDQRAANLQKLVDKARAQEEAGVATFRGFAETLAHLEEQEGDETEAALVDDDEDAVQLLTMHKSKGLEFPVVVLADLIADGRKGAPVVVDRGPPARFEFALGSKAFRQLETRGHSEAAELEQEKAQAESIRLLYVAATRARDLLVLPRFARVSRVSGQRLPAGLSAHLAGDPLFEAEPAAEPARVLDAQRFLVANEAPRAFRFALRPVLGRSAEAAGDLFERQSLRQSLIAAFTGDRHRRRIESASAAHAEAPVAARIPGAAARPRGAAGPDFGSFVHQLLERVDFAGRGAELPGLAELLGPRLLLDAAARAEGVRLVRELLDTPLLARLRAAARVSREVPFTVLRGDALLEGAIDVLAEEADGRLLIVDWKTDAVAGAALEQRLLDYRTQAAAYRGAVEQATGRIVAAVVLAFVRAGETREA